LKSFKFKINVAKRWVSLRKFSYIFSLSLLFLAPMPSNSAPPIPRVAKSEWELQTTPLKLDRDCRPSSWQDKLNLQLAGKAEEREFWLGQSYAVKRKYQEDLKDIALNQRLEQISSNAIDEQKAVERKSEDAFDAALGAYLSADQTRAKFATRRDEDKEAMEWRRTMAGVYAQERSEAYQRMIRCSKYADDRSK
jgi:hypothetical protein